MTKYLLYKARSITLHPGTVFWSVFFVLFWAIMWVYVFGTSVAKYSSMPWYREAVSAYFATAFGSLGIIAMGSAGIGLTQSLFTSIAAIRFLTRFSRLSPWRFIVEDLAASLLSLLVVALVEVVAVILLVWQRYSVLIELKHPYALLGLLVLLGLFFYELSLVSGYAALMVTSRHMRSALTGLSLIVSFVPYALLFTGSGNLAGYVFPPIGLQALIIGAVSGKTPPATNIINWFKTSFVEGKSYAPIDPGLVMAATLAWLLAMGIAAMELARRAKAVHPSELG